MDQYIGEIRMFAGNYAPQDWAFCNGQLIAIAQYEALYSLLGTTYGGDGQTTFALPNLQGRLPMGQGAGPGLTPRALAQVGGSESVTVTVAQMPSHTHQAGGQSSEGDQESPANEVWAATAALKRYASSAPNVAMNAGAIGPSGGSQPHENRMPALTTSFIIALEGIYPNRD